MAAKGCAHKDWDGSTRGIGAPSAPTSHRSIFAPVPKDTPVTDVAAAIPAAVLGLDRWFETTRVEWPTPGYGGPVIHWWNHCLAYRGTGLDWRYEGIMDGYLTLWRRTGDRSWLAKAIRAGEDLRIGQRADGHFTNSRFELNPGVGGTPHEAACDIALLLLAKELRTTSDSRAGVYLAAAQRNLSAYWIGRLWHAPSATPWDAVGVPSFVPNKAATFIEAILLLHELTGDNELIERYAMPTGKHILAMQVRQPRDALDGAIAQNRFGDRVVASYFPLYVARCVPALLRLAAATGVDLFRDGALAAAAFVDRVRHPDGGLPQVLYASGRRNRWPCWMAGAGDVVRALDSARERGLEVDSAATISWILRGVRGDGRIAAAEGFGRLVPGISRRDRTCDEIGVVGWCDKAFRALCTRVTADQLATTPISVSPRSFDPPGGIR
jgi:hypothetical protein